MIRCARLNRFASAVLAAAVIAVSCGALVAPARADAFQNDIRLWEPDTLLGRGPWTGLPLRYAEPAPAAYAAPFTGTPSKYPPTTFYGAAVVVPFVESP